MKRILTLFAILLTTTLFAQDPYLQKDYDTVEGRADAITETYNKELALSSKQELLFKQKVEEFLPRYDAIRENYSGTDKLDRLLSLGEEESGEMRDILTQPQFRMYVQMKEKIQPLGKVETKN
ncbi:hypothetical protein MG296_09450 [Flavobacteriaceae bacterium TK19130]|nr:hypothetical protein [Thermobacterium salinum]